MDKTKKMISENWLPEDRINRINLREEIEDHLRKVEVRKEIQLAPQPEIRLERGI